jgi:hypothetical protein
MGVGVALLVSAKKKIESLPDSRSACRNPFGAALVPEKSPFSLPASQGPQERA